MCSVVNDVDGKGRGGPEDCGVEVRRHTLGSKDRGEERKVTQSIDDERKM